MNKKKKISLLVVTFVFGILFSHNLFAADPGYIMKWEWHDNEGNVVNYDVDLVLGFIRNYSGKNITDIIISFTVFDSEGIPTEVASIKFNDFYLEDNKCLPFMIDIKSLEEHVGYEVDRIDFIYLSKIFYENGDTWEDPGLLYFTTLNGPEYEKQYEILEEQIRELLLDMMLSME